MDVWVECTSPLFIIASPSCQYRIARWLVERVVVMADAGRYDDLSSERAEALQQFMAAAFKLAESVPGGCQFFVDPPGYTIEQRARELSGEPQQHAPEEPVAPSANSSKTTKKATQSAEPEVVQLSLW